MLQFSTTRLSREEDVGNNHLDDGHKLQGSITVLYNQGSRIMPPPPLGYFSMPSSHPSALLKSLLLPSFFVALLSIASADELTAQDLLIKESTTKQTAEPSFQEVEITYSPAKGIGPDVGFLRRDPSDVILHHGIYYVWYTKVFANAPKFPEGYGGMLWYATSKDGKQWTEQGEALAAGAPGKFDSFGVFTPNILYAPTTQKYYLYYTGVQGDGSPQWQFKKFSGSIGVAVADSPDGGDNGWQRANQGNPVITPRKKETGVFDGWHVDDTVAFYRNGKYWLYYKGHSLTKQLAGLSLPHDATPMGVVVSDRPDGGFRRLPLGKREFLVQPGHELLLWPHETGLLSLPTGHYRPRHADDFRLHYSVDGLLFRPVSPNIPTARRKQGSGLLAPGIFRTDLTQPQSTNSPTPKVLWGISMTGYRKTNGKDAGLQRFEIKLIEK